MKRVILTVITLCVILGCFGITACSSGKENGNTTTQTQSNQQATATPSTKPVSVNNASWRDDMPIYPGSKEYFKAKSDESETVNDKPAVYESRMYETSAKKDDVAAFYKDKMAAIGWTETTWVELGSEGEGSSTMGEYEKNGGDNVAVIQISDTGKGTMIKLDTKYPK
jgi:hypothetical protein